MAYTKPDVFVTVDLQATSFEVPSPELLPCVIGEHYHVVKNAYAGHVQANEQASIPYPQLPKSFNKPYNEDGSPNRLQVDASGEFAPTVEMILASGERVDITDKVDFTPTSIEKTPISDLYDGQPYTGAIYVSYRALSDEYAGTNLDLLTASSTGDLEELFGGEGIGPANPLGFAMFQAMQHSQIACAGAALGLPTGSDGSGRYLGYIEDEIASYAQALDYLKSRNVYELVALTHNDYVLDLVSAHCDAMSSELGRSERRTVFSVEMDEFWPVRGEDNYSTWYSVVGETVEARTVLNGGTDPASGEESPVGTEITTSEGYTVKRVAAGDGSQFGTFIVNYVPTHANDEALALNGEDCTVSFETTLDADGDGATETVGRHWVRLSNSVFEPATSRIRVGDRIHFEGTPKEAPSMGTIYYPGVGGDERLLEVTYEDQTAQALDPLAENDPGAEPKRLRVYREETDRGMVEGLRAMAQSYASERIVIVAPDTVSFFVEGEEMDLPAYYAGAQLAAEMCLVGRVPAGAEPGANPLTGVRGAQFEPFMSRRFFTEEELDIAAEGGVTWLVNEQKGQPIKTRKTLTTDMSQLELSEAILGVERDYLAKTFRKALRPDLRKYRVDASLLSKLQYKADAIASDLTSSESESRCFRNIEIVTLKQHPDAPDTVIIEVAAEHLYVLNDIRVNVQIVV